MQNDIESMLVQWGKWSRAGCCNLGAKSIWPRDGAGGDVLMSDDDALRVDAAVAALAQQDSGLGDLIKLHYVRSLNQLGLQDRLGLSRRVVEKNLAEARGYVAGFIECRRRAA